METKNSEYWEDRIANETWRTYNNIEEKNIALMEMYDNTSQSIKKEMYALAEIAEEQNGLTNTQQYRLQKLLGEQGHIYKEIEKLGVEVEKHATEQIFKGGKSVYGNVRESLGDIDFSYPNKKEMEQMLRSPWHGSFFSKRLWEDIGKLERNLNGIINEGMSTGRTATEMAVQLSNIMHKSFNDAHRLVRTETINYMNRSAIRGYKDAGVTKVQWWAAEDERTCKTCGALHSKPFDIDKAPILPCHPGCRCTWLPVIGDGLKKIDILEVKSSTNKQKNEKLVKYANDSLSIPKVNLSGLDYNTTKNLLNTIAEVYNKYPELNGTIKEIIQTNSASMAVGIDGRYDNFILAISSKIYSNPTKAQEAMRRMIDVGKFAKGSTIETIPYHEFGHMFEGVYIQKNFSNNDMEKAWDDCLAATEILKQASIKCYNDTNRYRTELLSISGYALESDSEGLAECVHLEMTNRGSVFTNIVMKILRGK